MTQKKLPRSDFKYSLEFLKKLNSVVVDGERLAHKKIFDKYNVWIFFQVRMFFNDLKSFSHDKKVPKLQERTFSIAVRDFIIALSALTISLFGILTALISKPKFFVYSIDNVNSETLHNDARIDPIYKYLKNSGRSFFEILHSTYNFSLLKKFMKRKRLALYVKSIDTVFLIACLFGFVKVSRTKIEESNFSIFEDKEEREFAIMLADRYFGQIDKVIFRVRVLKKIISWIKPKAVFAIDNTRDYWELLLACKMSNIPFYAFQHGHFTKYHVGWLNDGSFDGEIVHPDRLYVWSEYWKKELIRLGTYFPEETILVGGVKQAVLPTIQKYKSRKDKITVLIPYEIDSNKDEVKEYIDKILSCGIRIIFKVRTDIDIDHQLLESGLRRDYHKDFIIETDTMKGISESDIVAGTYSTFLYDMVPFERPIAYLETDLDFGEGIVINGLADKVGKNNVCEEIIKIYKITPDVLSYRKHKLFGQDNYTMYETIEKIMSQLT